MAEQTTKTIPQETQDLADYQQKVMDLESKLASLKTDSERAAAVARSTIASLESKVVELEAATDMLAHSATPIVRVSPMSGNAVNQQGMITKQDSQGTVFAFQREIAFTHDAGYSADAMKARAVDAAHYALGLGVIGEAATVDDKRRYCNLPPFSPCNKLKILVWVEYHPEKD